jgi:hypothetical protein
MRLSNVLNTLESSLGTPNDQGDKILRLRSGRKRELPREVTDFVETNGDTEDKLNFSAINKGYAGLRPGIYDKKRPKAAMNRDQNIDVYHQI